ncbi:radical SAM protein [Acetobacter sp. AN02]|uniref:radical SAM protein n=1 Tax=Acetobacter sp. AN02 TaxID=2894186 RepID=UPI0024343CB6|nr:radical SAM protein [Acetobacter sp. AN02]MDG6094959.1 radical SAM protein [Acetobacter sp. AN02]
MTIEIGRRLLSLIPGAIDVSVTDYCNADCNLCGFAKSKMKGRPRTLIDHKAFIRALPILRRSDISFVNFQGGEPLLHPHIMDMIRAVRAEGMKPDLITNGWNLPDMTEELADAGLHNLFISFDSDDVVRHEENRGLKGVTRRIQKGIELVRDRRIPVIASFTLSRLVNFKELAKTLSFLGFDAVTFSYPRQEAFGSSSLVFDESSELNPGTKHLISFSQSELLEALDNIIALKKRFPVLNPVSSVQDIQRHVRREEKHFPCVGGFRYYYMDWDLNVWRCEAWDRPMGSVFDFEKLPEDRSRCTECMMSCYRDTSAIMYGAVTLSDAAQDLANGQFRAATRKVMSRNVAASFRSVISDARLLYNIMQVPKQG